MPETPNIMIGTPAYNGMVHTDYVHSLLSYNMSGIRFSFLSIGGESLITRARNSILAHFYHSSDFTHLLFLDGDVYLDGNSLSRLIAHDKDLIGAAVPLKTIENGKPVFNISGPIGEEDDLVRVERLGTAAMLLSRKAVDALVNDAIGNGRTYRANPHVQGLAEPNDIYDVFRVGVLNGEYQSEDFWVCHQLRDLGFNVYVDLSIRTRHHGMMSFG